MDFALSGFWKTSMCMGVKMPSMPPSMMDTVGSRVAGKQQGGQVGGCVNRRWVSSGMLAKEPGLRMPGGQAVSGHSTATAPSWILPTSSVEQHLVHVPHAAGGDAQQLHEVDDAAVDRADPAEHRHVAAQPHVPAGREGVRVGGGCEGGGLSEAADQ